MTKQINIIIAGVTCSGKTTISHKIVSKIKNVAILHQDDFYYTDYKNHLDRLPELDYYLFDKINAYDMDKMMVSINSQSANILVLEGILLLEDSRILKLADLIFFMVLDKNTCWERRKARTYLPPEPNGYFDKYAWPEYEKHLSMVKKKNLNIIFLNGSDSIDLNLSIVVNHINQKLLNIK